MKIKVGTQEFDIDDDKVLVDGKVSESVEIESDLVMRTPDEDTTFKKNAADEGFKDGAEIGRKNLLKGILGEDDVNGQHKNDETAIKAINTFKDGAVTKALEDAKVAPDEQITALKLEHGKDIETLKTSLATETKAKEDALGGLTSFKQTNAKTTELRKHLPEGLIISQDQAIKLMSSDINLDFTEEGSMVLKDAQGNVRKDTKTLEPIPIKTGVEEWFADNNDLVKGSTGGGGGDGGDSGGDGKETMKAFTEEMITAGHRPNDPKFVAEMNERIKNGTLTVD